MVQYFLANTCLATVLFVVIVIILILDIVIVIVIAIAIAIAIALVRRYIWFGMYMIRYTGGGQHLAPP